MLTRLFELAKADRCGESAGANVRFWRIEEVGSSTWLTGAATVALVAEAGLGDDAAAEVVVRAIEGAGGPSD